MYRVKRLKLHKICIDCENRTVDGKKLHLRTTLLKEFNLNNESHIQTLYTVLEQNFFNKYFKKWEESQRKVDRFEIKNVEWLAKEISFEFENKHEVMGTYDCIYF